MLVRERKQTVLLCLVLICITVTDSQDTSPTRWIIATLLPAFLAYRGLQKNSLDLSGAVLGILLLLRTFFLN